MLAAMIGTPSHVWEVCGNLNERVISTSLREDNADLLGTNKTSLKSSFTSLMIRIFLLKESYMI
jgi:hypothetical protein